MSGKFIVFEGINGSGKTTIINSLIDYYTKHNIKYKYIKFPNRKTESGKVIDKFLKNEYQFKSIRQQIEIFADNRKEAEDLILESLNNNEIILCDRYVYSNIAYILSDNIFDSKLNINSTTDLIIPNNKILTIDDIIYFDKGLLKPDFVFLVNGDYIHLRNNTITERYHSTSDNIDKIIKNKLIFNNFILSLNYTNTKYYIINNKLSNLDNIINEVNKIIQKKLYVEPTRCYF